MDGVHDMNDLKERIIIFEKDLESRIRKECELIRRAAKPKEEAQRYVENIRWNSPELAAHIKKVMLNILDSYD